MAKSVQDVEIGFDFERLMVAVWLLSTLYFVILGIIFWDHFSNRGLYFTNFFIAEAYISAIFFLPGETVLIRQS